MSRQLVLWSVLCSLAACNAITGIGDFDVGATTGGGSGGSTTGGNAGSGATGGSVGGSGGASGTAQGGSGGGTNCNATQKPLVPFSGAITSDFTLTCDKDYLLDGSVTIEPNVTLTIQAGTTIKGSASPRGVLVVKPDAQILAVGTADLPIVFTSASAEGQRKAGDWGGVVILGNARVNLSDPDSGLPVLGEIEGLSEGGEYGGIDDSDSSGVLEYVRVEYSGYAIAPNNELNGLTFGGVGSGTKVEHVMVRNTTDDCFEFFGGTVSAKWLICQNNGDDGFDWDNGYRGKIQFGVVQQDPTVADETNGLEGDNDASGSDATPRSAPTFYNLTLCGKNVELSKEQYGLLIRRGTNATIRNALVLGFEAGMDVRNANTSLTLENSVFWGNLIANIAYVEDDSNTTTAKDDDAAFDEIAYFSANQNLAVDPQVSGCFDLQNPSFVPVAPPTNGVAPPDDGFFDHAANYVGAFKDASDAWATGNWVVWGP